MQGLFFVIPVNSLVATFEQLLAVRGVAYAILGSKFVPFPSAHAYGTNGQFCTGRILFVHHCTLSMVCEHVLLIDDHAYYV